ncbi:MAG: hypothetical protein ACKOHM_09465 [Spartobacteria bacterium]
MTSLCHALDHFEPALQLEQALRKTAAPSPWPGLTDASQRAKAIALARENGLFERLAMRLAGAAQDPADDGSSAPEPTVIADALAGVSAFANRFACKPTAAPIERLDWSVIREYHRTGKWRDLGILMSGLARCQDEALALWLDHPSADAGRLEEIFAIVERLEEDRQDEIQRASAHSPGGTVGADCVAAAVAIDLFTSTPSAPTGIAVKSPPNHQNQTKRRVS